MKKLQITVLEDDPALVAMNPEPNVAVEELGCHYIEKLFRIAEFPGWVDECAERALES